LSFVAKDPGSFAGQAVGSGHCVAYVQQSAGAPHTSHWRRGVKVRGSGAPAGTAIATFGGAPARYENRTDGSSHAAILIAEDSGGLRVWDQWRGHPVSQRTIRHKGGAGTANNDGDRFFVIETDETV
jgi:hypothetical protein